MHQANGLEIQMTYAGVFEVIFIMSKSGNAEISGWALETKQVVGRNCFIA